MNGLFLCGKAVNQILDPRRTNRDLAQSGVKHLKARRHNLTVSHHKKGNILPCIAIRVPLAHFFG